MTEVSYVHGTDAAEQERLYRFNALNNAGFLSALPVQPADHILEVGSGLGVLARMVSERVPQGRVVGVEQSADQLRHASEGPRLSFVRGDAHDVPFPDATFDTAYCRWVLEHVRDPARVLREMFRVVRPGGHVLVEENDNSLQRYDPPCPRFERVWAQFNVLQSKLGGDGLIGSKLYGLLRRTGFSDVRMLLHPHLYHAGTDEFACWVENEAVIIEGAAKAMIEHGLANSEEIAAALAELRGLPANPEASSWFYFSQALGTKPLAA